MNELSMSDWILCWSPSCHVSQLRYHPGKLTATVSYFRSVRMSPSKTISNPSHS